MALPSLMHRSVDLPVRSHGSALSSPSRQRRASVEHRHVPEITLYLEQKRTRPGASPYLESVQVPISSTVKDVRLKLQNLKGWHADKAKCSLVLGDRDLMEHEVVGQLAKKNSANPDYLHVFVKLSDVSSVTLDTESAKPLIFDLSDAPSKTPSPRSALTHSLVTSPFHPSPSQTSLILRSQVVDSKDVCILPDSADPLGDAAGEAVVHLVIQRPAKLGWHHAHNNNFELSISRGDTADTVKRKLEDHHGLPADSHSLLYNGKVLSCSKPLLQYGIDKGSVLELAPFEPSPTMTPSTSPMLSSPEHELFEGWQKARAGLAKGFAPRLATAGTGGSYFICDEEGTNVAVFKPEDEEPLAINNPKGGGSSADCNGSGLRRGIKPGEGAVREVAAFLLDHQHFSGVPPTAMVTCLQRRSSAEITGAVSLEEAKLGSLQQFVKSDGDCEERGSSVFAVKEVHKIAVLDIRLANTDRNGANILARRNGAAWDLIPIDHGYCLPATFQDISFEWLYWPQARAPFDTNTLKYIQSLDSAKDLAVLVSHGLMLRPECERVLSVCTMLLKKGAARGMTPFSIGNIMCREALTKSPLEKLHKHALDLAAAHFQVSKAEVTNEHYLLHMSAVLDEYLDETMLEGVGHD
ncbi:hypothetical protein WJX77_011492 [Trebouxia sp. C0004]